MGTKAAAKVLGIVLLAQMSTAAVADRGRGHAEPIPVAPGVTVFEADREHVRLVRWAATRFDSAGLVAPAVEVHFHRDTTPCLGHLGSELGGRVDLCVAIVSEVARKTLLHEMGHAWIDANMTASDRERFMAERGLVAWNDSAVPWDDRAYEHGAEIIAWGLGDRYIAPTIPDREPARLTSGFELLTGVALPHPGNV